MLLDTHNLDMNMDEVSGLVNYEVEVEVAQTN